MLLGPAGGTGGATGTSGSGGDGSSGGGGSSGSSDATEPRDAGPEAAPPQRSCVVGSLERYCALGDGYCPATYADARTKLRARVLALDPSLILQQACTAPDGSARLRVSGVYGWSLSMSYIYDPTDEQLVSVQIYDDLGGCGNGEPAYGFGSTRGFYGEDLPGCSFSYSNFAVPPECELPENWRERGGLAPEILPSDAGADSGALDGGAPFECILAP